MHAFNALIVEGTHGIGKSTLIDVLLREHVARTPQRKIRTLIHLTQAHTYGPLAPAEDDGSLTVERNLRHLDDIVRMLEWLGSAVAYKERPACFAIVDTLHLTHCARPGVVTWPDVAPVDRRLAAIGCKLLFLRGSESTIRTRGIEAAAGTQFLAEYARKFGDTPEQLHAYFVNEQARLEGLARRSALRTLVLDRDGDALDVAEAAYRFWID